MLVLKDNVFLRVFFQCLSSIMSPNNTIIFCMIVLGRRQYVKRSHTVYQQNWHLTEFVPSCVNPFSSVKISKRLKMKIKSFFFFLCCHESSSHSSQTLLFMLDNCHGYLSVVLDVRALTMHIVLYTGTQSLRLHR